MHIRPFTDYIIEQDEKPRVETTGHMIHVGDMLYSGSPSDAIDHSRAMFNRFNGLHTADHNASLKVDGGMSVIMGKEADGRPFVGYKSGRERFYDHDSIAASGKEHYVRTLSPALDATASMENLKDGVAVQADVLHGPEHKNRVYQSNTIRYKTNPRAKGKFAFAPHSQYDVTRTDLIKTSDEPDHEQLQSSLAHAPELSLTNREFNLSPYRKDSIAQHLAQAEDILGDETTRAYAGRIPEDKNFHKLLQGYSNHTARTSGRRTLEGLKDFADGYVTKTRPESTRGKWLKGHMKHINNNATQLDNLFTAHHHINHAKHHMLDSFRAHHDDYDIVPHGNHEHEGLVGHLKDKTSAKFVREGPGGFSAKNAAAAERFSAVAPEAPAESSPSTPE